MIAPEQWIGYMEHRTPDRLEEFTENVGKGGCTIFAVLIAISQGRRVQGYPWCAIFVHACVNRPDLLGPAHPGTRVLARRMMRKGFWRGRQYHPCPGDLVFCAVDGRRICHVGIVECCDGKTVTSIDGNTVDASGCFPPERGGAVARRERELSDPVIVGYAAIGKLIQE